MADAWYVGRNTARTGPFSLTQLRRMVASGQVVATDLVWREGMANWMPCATVAELQGDKAAAEAQNPYAAPKSSATPDAIVGAPRGIDGPGGRLAHRPFSFSAAFDVASQTFMAQWGPLVLTGLVGLAGFLLTAVPQWILQAIGVVSGSANVMSMMNVASSCSGFIVNILVGGPLLVGLLLAGANIAADRPQLSDVFLGFKRYGRVVAAQFLVQLCLFGALIAAYLPGLVCIVIAAVIGRGQNAGNPPVVGMVLIGIGVVVSLVLIVAAMALVGTRIFFVPVIVADQQLGSVGVRDAFRLNWSTVTGMQGLSLLGLALVVGLFATLSLILLCVPYLLAGFPFMIAAAGAAYALLFRQGSATAPEAI